MASWTSEFQFPTGKGRQCLTYLLQNSIGAVSVESTLLEDKCYSSRSDWLPVPLSVGSPESSSVEVGILKLTNLGNFPLSHQAWSEPPHGIEAFPGL